MLAMLEGLSGRNRRVRWEPVGGAARMAHVVKSLAAEKPLVVFSGDAFNPSLLSTITLGAQMPPILNEIGVHVACIGEQAELNWEEERR